MRRAAIPTARALFFAAVVANAIFAASATEACEASADLIDNPALFRVDGSFENINTEPGEIGRDRLSGGKIWDRGSGRVAQRVADGAGCFTIEYLVFVDCVAGEAIALQGTSRPPEIDGVDIGDIYMGIEYIQPPYGEIRAGSRDTIATLMKQATKAHIQYSVKDGPNDDRFYWRRFRWNVGCKHFYPDSLGAQN